MFLILFVNVNSWKVVYVGWITVNYYSILHTEGSLAIQYIVVFFIIDIFDKVLKLIFLLLE